VITELEQLTVVETRRIHVDKGYRGCSEVPGLGHLTAPIRHEMKPPVIGHVTAEHRCSPTSHPA